jgi:predicted site-specific integrase-resolvase
LTMAELARQLQVSRYWIERRIHDGTIRIVWDAEAKRYLFPDTEATIAALQQLKSGKTDHIHIGPKANN